jgi:NAD(P)-dependent dehydrogenase (short-subunit alcohol dehydrogenase family)
MLRRINATGVYNGSKHALVQMIKQDVDAKGCRGRIVNVSSVMGLVASAGGAGEQVFSIPSTFQFSLVLNTDDI